jgi:hypothetical protein
MLERLNPPGVLARAQEGGRTPDLLEADRLLREPRPAPRAV